MKLWIVNFIQLDKDKVEIVFVRAHAQPFMGMPFQG